MDGACWSPGELRVASSEVAFVGARLRRCSGLVAVWGDVWCQCWEGVSAAGGGRHCALGAGESGSVV